MQPTPTDSSQVLQMVYRFKWFTMESNLYFYIAVAIGFFIIFISYFFGGGSKARLKIIFSIILSTAIGTLTLPLLLKIAGTDPSPTLVGFFIFIDFVFIAVVAVHFYELIVIGTHEALFNK